MNICSVLYCASATTVFAECAVLEAQARQPAMPDDSRIDAAISKTAAASVRKIALHSPPAPWVSPAAIGKKRRMRCSQLHNLR